MATEGDGEMKRCASLQQLPVYQLQAETFDRESSIESWVFFSIFFSRSTGRAYFFGLTSDLENFLDESFPFNN